MFHENVFKFNFATLIVKFAQSFNYDLQRPVSVLEGEVEEERAVAGVGRVVLDEAGSVVGEDVL